MATLALAVVSCGATEPINGLRGGLPDAGLPDAAPIRGVPLRVDGLPPQTYWSKVPMFGQGPVNGSVVVEGNQGAKISTELGVDGSFCLEIPLQKSAQNNLTVFAISQSGERSDSQTFQISQSGTPPAPGVPVPPKNIALGGLPSQSTMQEQDGLYAAITDGTPTTGMVMQNAVFDEDWFVLRIPTPKGATSVRIYSNQFCEIGEYLLHTAPLAQAMMPVPSDLDADALPWAFRGHVGTPGGAGDMGVTDCSTGTLVCHEFVFDAAVVGAVGIRFIKSSCSNFVRWEEHSVNEIEVWTPPGVTPPGESAPSCQGGA